ncbi:hypothetical protein, partial [Pseudomonas aeruginosa]|uniref:hypothetical protein n=1 Tax=Pseudomonas aeruginosa TaxID=287 RepID=UPI002901E1C4
MEQLVMVILVLVKEQLVLVINNMEKIEELWTRSRRRFLALELELEQVMEQLVMVILVLVKEQLVLVINNMEKIEE